VVPASGGGRAADVAGSGVEVVRVRTVGEAVRELG
jgi:hypothetical protein